MASIAKAARDLFRPDVLSLLLHTRSLFQWALAALRKQDIAAMEIGDKDIIIEYRGCRFKLDPITCQPIFDAYNDYRFNRIQPDDAVLDIGAQVGAFAIPAAKRARVVYAVEPVFHAELIETAELNSITNIVPLHHAIGNSGQRKVINYGGISSKCLTTISFGELHKQLGQIDFLKIDCEGCEWDIEPRDLAGIRSIDAELHTLGLGHRARLKLKEWERWLSENGYICVIDRIDSTRCMLHAEREGK